MIVFYMTLYQRDCISWQPRINSSWSLSLKYISSFSHILCMTLCASVYMCLYLFIDYFRTKSSMSSFFLIKIFIRCLTVHGLSCEQDLLKAWVLGSNQENFCFLFMFIEQLLLTVGPVLWPAKEEINIPEQDSVKLEWSQR